MRIYPNAFHRIFAAVNAQKHSKQGRKDDYHYHEPKAGPKGPKEAENPLCYIHAINLVDGDKAVWCFQVQNTNNRALKHVQSKLQANQVFVAERIEGYLNLNRDRR